jgi:UDP-N-acetyl-D-glucosamine dehydrogenase
MSVSIKSGLIARFEDKSATIAIVGIGYVGLPLAVTFADAGFHVIGIDPVEEKVAAVNRGESYIQDVPTTQLARLVNDGYLKATTDYAVLAGMDAVSICVPTPLSKFRDPDLSYIVSATTSVAPYLHRGMVVVLESSTYPGTTRELVLPQLEQHSGLKVGIDFFLIGPRLIPLRSWAESRLTAATWRPPGIARR